MTCLMVDFLQEKNACTWCLSWLHVRADCPYDNFTCPVKENGSICGKHHNKLLHKSRRPVIINNAFTSVPEGDDILAPIVKDQKMIALLDPRSNTTIITHSTAKKVSNRNIPVPVSVATNNSLFEYSNNRRPNNDIHIRIWSFLISIYIIGYVIKS